MRLPVYTSRPLAWETTQPKPHDRSCAACSRAGRGVRCLAPGQRPGTGRRVLILTSRVGYDDNTAGRLAVSGAAGWVFQAASSVFDQTTHLLIDVALRCGGGGEDETAIEVDACRPYTSTVIRSFRPDLILACGEPALRSVVGERVDVRAAARGWALSQDGTPVVVLLDEFSAWSNAFLRERFLADLQWVAQTTAADFGVAAWTREEVTRENIHQAIAELRAAPWCGWDTEYAGLAFDTPHYFEVLSHGLAAGNGYTVWTWHGAALRDPVLAEPLYALLEDPEVLLVAQDAKADLVAMASAEPTTGRRPIHVKGICMDPLLIRHIQDPDVDADLETIGYLVGRGQTKGVLAEQLAQAQEWIAHVRKKAKTGSFLPGWQHPAYDQAVRHPKRSYQAVAYALVNPATLVEYQATDTATTTDLGRLLARQIASDPVVREGWRIMQPLPEVAARMEAAGMAVDESRLRAFEAFLRTREHTLGRDLSMLLKGERFNPNSDDDVAHLLYDRFQLPCHDFTDSGKPSTAAEVLEKIMNMHPVVPLIVSAREVSTYLSRYAEGMRRHVRGDGRIHPRFNLDGTRTGRWSSSDPNFQNLAEHADMAKYVKRYLVAKNGWVFMAYDFSQLEYVMASIVSGDPVMQQIFKDGKDMHRRTAELIGPVLWKIATEVMEAMGAGEMKPYRQKAKAVNFGALFNMQASTLAKQLGCSEQEAAKILHAILYGLFPTFAAWRDKEIQTAMATGQSLVYSVSDGGDLIPIRRRPMVGLASSARRTVGNAINASVNTPVQGSASVIQAKAIVGIDRYLQQSGLFAAGLARIVNAIHDATYLEVHESVVAEVHHNVEPLMIKQPTRDVPLRVECKVGPDLASLVDFDTWITSHAA